MPSPKKRSKTVPQKPAADAAADLAVQPRPSGFPIVAIGASAGGLEALGKFLKNVPEDLHAAFVVVQHLDPTHKGLMVELLQRLTTMKVLQVKDRMPVEPGCVYVIPPNKDMSILHGLLYLLDPAAPRGLRLPIDLFFRSLADDRQEQSVGVILSGMGSDGTLGLRAIKEKAGVAFVQSRDSAKFDGMPGSAIDAGLADVVAPVEELPGKILAYLQHAPSVSEPKLILEDKSQSALEKIVILLRAKMGHDFSLYKKNTIYRRVERRMSLHQLDRIADYLRFLQENPQEVELLFKELLIGVTSFFRDPKAWEELGDKVMPALLTGHAGGGVLRAWTPGCSTGEEAYSLAILFKEALARLKPAGRHALQIFATDLDKDAIDQARQGVYPANIAADVSPQRLRQFFTETEHGYRIGKEIREMVIFAQQNVVMDPPFTKLDILVCRNLLIYLSSELRKKLIPLFHYSLRPGGVLFLGSAETVGSVSDLFSPLEGKLRLYRRSDSQRRAETAFCPAAHPTESPVADTVHPVVNLQSLADQALLRQFCPTAVLASDKGDILYISGRTGKYLEPAAGKANWNLFVMAREGLRYELASAFRKALQQPDAVVVKNLRVGTNGGLQIVDVSVQALQEPEALRGTVMVVFSDVSAESEPPAASEGKRSRRSPPAKLELQRAREEVQTVREEMQASQEELSATNEELQSANEELQSTNEELVTSKEEMQSLNEELQTVNNELQAKVDQLSRTSSDMKNLLNSTNIATLFLDDALCVRRFTPQAASIIKLIASDVGRPITDLTTDLDYPALADDAREVLRTLMFCEKPIATHDGRWFSARIMPYRTEENQIDGLVITFSDITALKTLEAEMRKAQATLQQHAANQAAELVEAQKKIRKQGGDV